MTARGTREQWKRDVEVWRNFAKRFLDEHGALRRYQGHAGACPCDLCTEIRARLNDETWPDDTDRTKADPNYLKLHAVKGGTDAG